jgi:tetratricopeptide (TPR) repeat protein
LCLNSIFKTWNYEKKIPNINIEKDFSGNNQLSIEYFSKGNSKIGYKDFRSEITDYIKAIDVNSKIYCNRSVAKYEAFDYLGSVTDFNNAITENPNDAKAYFRNGLVKIEV